MSNPIATQPITSLTFGVQWLLDPHRPDTFFMKYWEQQPLHIRRGNPAYFLDLFSSRRMEEVLFYGKPKPPDLRVVADQQELLPSKYLTHDGDLNLNQLYKVYAEGHTIIVNGLQRFCHPVAALCGRVQNLINYSIIANVYLSPAGPAGLHPHFDTHDVFVLQIEGAKTWYLYGSPQPLPLLKSFQPVIPRETLGEPQQIVQLEAGDLLYVPRGVVHHAETTARSSLHMTLGVYALQWVDLLSYAMTALSARDVRFRRAVPPAFLDRDVRGELEATFTELLATLQGHASLEEGLAIAADSLLRKSVAIPDGHFSQVDRVNDIFLTTLVVRRTGLRCALVRTATGIGLQFPGNTVQGTPAYQAAMQFIAGIETPFSPASLPGELDDVRRIGLVQRLVHGGLLRIATDEEMA